MTASTEILPSGPDGNPVADNAAGSATDPTAAGTASAEEAEEMEVEAEVPATDDAAATGEVGEPCD